MSKDITIGIDLGTSNSCVATVSGDEPLVLANALGERTTASVVAFREDGSIDVGNQAKAQIILDPKHTVSSAKRLIGRFYFSEELRKARAICNYEIVPGENHSVRIQIRQEQFSLPEISAFVLKEMKQIAERELGCEVERAVIAVPAYFNDNQRQATKDAGRIAGLDVLRILNEPTAAALAYGYGRELMQKVVVYDFGGGTFDVSVLEIGHDVYEVLSTCGDTFLGGDDFDDRLIDLLADKVLADEEINLRSDPVAFERLKQAAERAKIDLSENESTHVAITDLAEVDGRQIGLEYDLSREEFDALVNDLVQRTFKVCDEAMQGAGLTNRDIKAVVLVGGPTRLPTIREAVENYFQQKPQTGINPDEVVAIGAAIHANSLASSESNTYLLDVTPLTLRLGIAGEMTEPIIERNSPVPIDHTRAFTTARDYQETIAVKIYQGESRAIEGNELLGEFEFSGFEAGRRGVVQIEVTFEINTEGIVNVRALDPATGAAQSTTVTMSSGLSNEEIGQIITRGRAADVAKGHQPVAAGDSGSPSSLPSGGPPAGSEELLMELTSDGPEEEAEIVSVSINQSGIDEEDGKDDLFGSIDGDLAADDPEAQAGGRMLDLDDSSDGSSGGENSTTT
ncbi:MAG: Hsp70 family protein [Myxococcota bacterium]